MLTALTWIGIIWLVCFGALLELCLRAPTIEDMDDELPDWASEEEAANQASSGEKGTAPTERRILPARASAA
jgi:hypothetical protein